jgi:hypothetical protein
MNPLFAGLVLLVQGADNPDYKAWAGFKEGSWVKRKTTSLSRAHGKSELETTFKLLQLTPEKAVIEISCDVLSKGKRESQPVRRQEIAAKAPPPFKFAGSAAPKPKTQEGEEELKIAERTVPCRWVLESWAGGSRKTWQSSEIPGGLAKSEMKGPEGGSTEEVLALEAQK